MAIVDKFIEHRVLLEYQKNRIVNQSVIELMLMLPELDSLVKFLIKNKVTRMNKQQEAAFLNILETSYKDVSTYGENSTYELSKYEAVFNRSLITDLTIGTAARSQLVKADYFKMYQDTDLLGATFKSRMKADADLSTMIMKNAINTGLNKGVGFREIAKALRTSISMPKAHLDTAVRTNIVHVVNQTNMALYDENDDIIKGLQFTAILDNRTTDYCRQHNGKVYTRDQIKEKKLKIPAHWNCRSFWMPVFYISQMGQDPDQLSYKEWQQKQGPSKDHLISEDENGFILNKEKQMTLDQMKRIEV